jgi:hypothetical protein
MGKTLALFLIGRAPLEEGMNLVGAHIDSPRLDVKQIRCLRRRDVQPGYPLTTAASKISMALHAAGAARRGGQNRRLVLSISVGEARTSRCGAYRTFWHTFPRIS